MAGQLNPNDLSQYGAQYVTDPQAAQQHLDDLLAYQQQIAANPSAYPNADFLNQQITNGINSQKQVVDYANKLGQYNTATQSIKKLQPDLGSIVSLGDISKNDSLLGRTAANQAVWAKYGRNAKGYELGSGEGINRYGIGSNFDAARLWEDAYRKAVKGAQDQLKQNSSVVNSGDADKAYGSLLQGFTLPKQDYKYGADQLKNYYGLNDPTLQSGQIGAALQPQVKDIYAKRWGTTMAGNEGLNAQGLLGSGARKNQQNKINSAAYGQEQGIKSDYVGQAQKSLGDYMNYGAQQDTKAADLENQVKNSGMGSIFGTSVGNAVKDYGQASQLGNQQAIDANKQTIQKEQEDDAFWNDLAGKIGGTVGTLAGAAL